MRQAMIPERKISGHHAINSTHALRFGSYREVKRVSCMAAIAEMMMRLLAYPFLKEDRIADYPMGKRGGRTMANREVCALCATHVQIYHEHIENARLQSHWM